MSGTTNKAAAGRIFVRHYPQRSFRKSSQKRSTSTRQSVNYMNQVNQIIAENLYGFYGIKATIGVWLILIGLTGILGTISIKFIICHIESIKKGIRIIIRRQFMCAHSNWDMDTQISTIRCRKYGLHAWITAQKDIYHE